MKRAARNSLATRVGQRRRTGEHARRRPPRKSQQQHRLGPHARLHETRHTINQRPRLSRARSGNDQKRPFGRRHRFELCFVKFFLVVYPASARRKRDAFQDQLCFSLGGCCLAEFEGALESLEFRREVRDCLIAMPRRFVQSLADDSLKLKRQLSFNCVR
jgi:hypothetical protein